MKVMFIETRSDLDIKLPDSCLKKLPKTIALFTTVQHIHKIEDAKSFLERNGRVVILLKGKHSRHQGQMVGCDTFKFNKDAQAFLYIGTGEFHPLQLSLIQDKPVFVFNPGSGKFYKMDKKKVGKLKRRKRGSYMKFLDSEEIGVLISTKPGQMDLKKALELKEKYKDKNFYYLIFNTLNFSELENFPFVQCFVNTACPRIVYDKLNKPIVNIDDI